MKQGCSNSECFYSICVIHAIDTQCLRARAAISPILNRVGELRERETGKGAPSLAEYLEALNRFLTASFHALLVLSQSCCMPM